MVFPACIMSDPITDNIGNSFSFDSRIPLYPFGFGLSYTKLTYGMPKLTFHNVAMKFIV
jgi:hypothetical protein